MIDKNTQSFASALQKFLKSENLERPFQEKKLIQSWETLMGKTIASRTSKLSIRKQVLYIQLTSAPLRQEMINSRDKILEIIRAEYGDSLIKEIRIN